MHSENALARQLLHCYSLAIGLKNPFGTLKQAYIICPENYNEEIDWAWFYVCANTIYSVSQKKSPPTVFGNFFPNGWEFLINFLHTYYTIISTLDYKFLFQYLQIWQSYAILSATTYRIFTFH